MSSTPAAACIGHPIGHSQQMNGLLAGLLVGALVGVAIVATGGLAAPLVVGAVIAGSAAAGAGVGEVLSTMSWAPKEVVGAILKMGSSNVRINSKPVARAIVDEVDCNKHPGEPRKKIATGSGNVFVNGYPVARVDDKTECSAVITEGSKNVFIGGGTVQYLAMEPENLVPGWVHATLLVVGVASAVVLAGPIVAGVGLVGGLAGGVGGNYLGGKIFGEGSDGQKWMMLGGSFLGGAAGAKGGGWLAGKAIPNPATGAQAFAKGGVLEANQFGNSRGIARNKIGEGAIKFSELTPGAKRLVTELDTADRVGVGNGVKVEDVRLASHYINKEIAIVQNKNTGELTAIKGTYDRMPAKLIRKDEEYLLHTHPTFTSEPGHFKIDLLNAGERVEAVIDRGGNITYYNNGGFVTNPEIKLINDFGYIVGYKR